MRYYPQDLKPLNKKVRGIKCGKHDEHRLGRPSDKESYVQEFTNYPKDILRFGNGNNKKLHPTQKPVALLEYLIKTYTTKHDKVLDCFMGSGSTGVACKNLNRQFIGMEQHKPYFDIAS